MKSYHGTSTADATTLKNGNVDVSLGGGELGQGFYTGEHIYEAKQWAYHTTNNKQKNVVEFITDDNDVEQLNLEIMEARHTSLHRYRIRKYGKTRIYTFGKDMVWAPIVGSEKASGDQFKWESQDAQDLLNDLRRTSKKIY